MALRLPFLRLLARYLDCAVLALRRAPILHVRSSPCPSRACWRAAWTAWCWRSGALPPCAYPPLLVALAAPAGALPGPRGAGAQARFPLPHARGAYPVALSALPGCMVLALAPFCDCILSRRCAYLPSACWRTALHCICRHADSCTYIATRVQTTRRYCYPCGACCATVSAVLVSRGKAIAPTACSALRSYRGYGLSEGSPSERGLQQDSQAALDYLLRRPDVHPRRVGAKPQPHCFACIRKACCRPSGFHP